MLVQESMKIEAHILCWNESEILPLTIKHYQTICSKIIIHDNFSTDNSRDIAESMGCEVRMFGIQGQLNDAEYIKLKNNVWKGSDADYVIVCDCDEILYHEDLRYVLRQERLWGTTIFKPQGYNMFSTQSVGGSYMDVKTGVKANDYSKVICFDPSEVNEIGYVYGCHESSPTGNLKWNKEPLMLLHYKHGFGVERVIKRHQDYEPRLSPINKRWDLGKQYFNSGDEDRISKERKYFNDNLAKSSVVV